VVGRFVRQRGRYLRGVRGGWLIAGAGSVVDPVCRAVDDALVDSPRVVVRIGDVVRSSSAGAQAAGPTIAIAASTVRRITAAGGS
jgi:hypothetical protein